MEQIERRQIETIESEGDVMKIRGIKSCKNMRNFLQSRINDQLRYHNKEMEMLLRQILRVYEHFHPQMKASVPIKEFKGKSGIQIVKYPNYFETIQFRKTDTEIKEIRHKITKEQLSMVIKAIKPLNFNEKYKTRYIAQEYCKVANLWENSRKRQFFDKEGFNFEQFSGSRNIYTPFNLCLKILQYYGMINYYKNGEIEKLKDNIDVQVEFL